jgi:segregation and condensation protein B
MAEGTDYKRVAEAALFTAGRAVSCDELGSLIGIAAVGHVRTIMDELIKEYEQRNGALEVRRIGDSYILEVRDTYAQKVAGLAGSPDISRASLKILAYISKNEPIMQSSVVKAFGSSAYAHIKELVEKEFIRALRTGRTRRIETTNKFREYFGI